MPALENSSSGRGSARLERCVRVAEVPGSNPGAPTGDQTGGDNRRPFSFFPYIFLPFKAGFIRGKLLTTTTCAG